MNCPQMGVILIGQFQGVELRNKILFGQVLHEADTKMRLKMQIEGNTKERTRKGEGPRKGWRSQQTVMQDQP